MYSDSVTDSINPIFPADRTSAFSDRVAVFVDGHFWLLCLGHCTIRRGNLGWWLRKLGGNHRRYRRKRKALVEMGWLAIPVWEHQNMDASATRIAGVS